MGSDQGHLMVSSVFRLFSGYAMQIRSPTTPQNVYTSSSPPSMHAWWVHGPEWLPDMCLEIVTVALRLDQRCTRCFPILPRESSTGNKQSPPLCGDLSSSPLLPCTDRAGHPAGDEGWLHGGSGGGLPQQLKGQEVCPEAVKPVTW